MRQSTSALRDYLDGKNGNRQIKVKLVYPGGDEIRSVQTLDYDCSFGNSLALGNTVSANIRVTCETPAFDVSEREFTLFFGAKLPGDTDETWTQIGIFRTVPKSTETRMGFTTFTAYDRMYIKTNKQYKPSLDIPADCHLSDVLADACRQGTWLTSLTLDYNPAVNAEIFNEYSIRDVIGFIASYQGKNAYADCDGNLTFKWFTSCDYTADGTKSNVPFADEKDTTINILVCSTGDDNIQAGTGHVDTELLSFNNPVMTEEHLEEIKDAIKGFTYRRLDADIPLGNYLVESGDIVKIKYENEAFNFDYTVPAMSVSYHYDGGLSSKISSYGVPDGIMKSISAKKFHDHTKFNGLQQAIFDATNAITGATGGYVRINFGDDGQTAEILILDDPDISKAQNVWRFNQEGLGHSSTGYNGTYGLALTRDGTIVADKIAGNEIAGIIIKTIATGIKDKSYVKLLEGGLTYFTSLSAAGEGAEEGREIGKSVLVKQGGNEGIANLVRQGSFWSIGKLFEDGNYFEEVIYTPSPGPNMDCELKVNGNLLVERWGKNTEYENVALRIDDFNNRIEALEGMFRLVIREE